MFTQDQIDLIIGIVDERIAYRKTVKTEAERPPFHSIHCIRQLILSHLEEFKDFCNGEDFHTSMLVVFLKQKTTLSLLDLETREGKLMTRFEHQCHHALYKWEDGPIETAVRRGYWCFVDQDF